MRTSNYYLATQKETPADAEIISHKLMLRAGMIRRLAAGIYDWLPLGLKVVRKVEAIVREEMNHAGALEVLLPAVQPAEIWKQSGRWDNFGPELARFQDRHKRDYCLGPTHEEVITLMVRNELKSYRQLPINFYQIQTKFRDEVRPRFGVMRGREFIMKDAYSFDMSREGLEQAYQVMYDAYVRIFDRMGLEYCAVAADSGAIGGSVSHEFHVLADSGEDAIALCVDNGYAANVELVPAPVPEEDRPAPGDAMAKVATPGVHTMADLAVHLEVPLDRTIKTLLVRGTGGPVALVLRGDHELNAVKAQNIEGLATPFQFATASEIRSASGADAGSVGPVGLDIPVFADHSAAVLADFVCGANEDDHHLTNVNWGRDLPEPHVLDLRKVVHGDPCPPIDGKTGGRLEVTRGIEVGHVFQLGTKYSDSLDAVCLDEKGRKVNMYMGCYGIGVTRVVAAAIEQNHDERGIIWPQALAPFDIALVPIGYQKSGAVREATDRLYGELVEAGFDVLLDDRDERPGVLFADMELIGIPHRLVVGERSLKANQVEYRGRRDEQSQDIGLDDLTGALEALVEVGSRTRH